MNKSVVLAGLAAMVFSSTEPAHADTQQLLYTLGQQIDQAFYRDGATKSWRITDGAGDINGAECKKTLAALAKENAPGSSKVELSNDNPELVKGTYKVDDVRSVCDMADRYARINAWEKWAFLSVQESGKIGGGKYYDTAFFEQCVGLYDQLMKAGVAKTQKVLEREILGPGGGEKIRWSGTIEELRVKWCDIGLKKVKAEIEAKQAPYKKALKNDKLSMVLPANANAVRAYILPGGAVSSDPKKLAAAKIWFSDTQSVNSTRLVCKGGQEIHTVHRYQFDANHKLVKTTDKDYCGAPPKSAYK